MHSPDFSYPLFFVARHAGSYQRPASRSRDDLQTSVHAFDAFSHSHETEVFLTHKFHPLLWQFKSNAIIFNFKGDIVVIPLEADKDLCGIGMTRHVCYCLLINAEQIQPQTV